MKKALVVAFIVALPPHLSAHHGMSHRVPTDIEVEAGNKAFLEGHAVGTQNYMCLVSGSAFAWTPVGPQATLFDDDGRQIITHFLSPNPDEGGIARATWQHSRDTSAVWAVQDGISTDAAFVAPGSIPWLRLRHVGDTEGPTGGDRLAKTTFIQRINTRGGVAPSTGCSTSMDLGKRAFVPYEADYVFFKERGRED
jgi:Protein of unknown function (DUF3455)